MKSLSAASVVSRVRRLVGDDNDLAVSSNELMNPQRFDNQVVLDAVNFACKEYVKFMDSARSKMVYAFNSDGETKIPMDNMFVKDVWITDETPDEYDPYEFFYLADHMVITYGFTDGADLDTRTKLVYPTDDVYSDDGPNDYLGWGRASTIALDDAWFNPDKIVLTWGGDNRGTGVEAVWVDLNKIRTLRPLLSDITIDCRCFWFETAGLNPVSLEVVLYKGGSVLQDGYGFINPTATDSKSLGFVTKAITLSTRDRATNGERAAVMKYNLNTGYGFVDTEDTTVY